MVHLKFVAISDNSGEKGDGIEIKSVNGVTTFSTDHNEIGSYGETIMTMIGNDNAADRQVLITGTLQADKLAVQDNDTINIGTGSDMKLYHDGSDSYISNETGNLKIGTLNDSANIDIGSANSQVTIGDNLSVSGNATITGDLTVSGTMTTTHTTSYTVVDKLIKLRRGNTGTAHDLGIAFTRGGGGSTNISNNSLIWDESEDVFAFAQTNTEDGSTNGNVTIDGYSNLKLGGLTASENSVFNKDVNVNGSLVLGTTTIDEDSLALINGITTLGTSQNGKAVTQSNSGEVVIGSLNGDQILNIASHDGVDGGLKLNNVLVKSSAAELNLLDGVQSGIVKSDSAVVYGANGEVNMNKLQINSESVTSTAAEINILDGVTATTENINLLTGTSANVNESKAVIYGAGGEVNATKLQIGGEHHINRN